MLVYHKDGAVGTVVEYDYSAATIKVAWHYVGGRHPAVPYDADEMRLDFTLASYDRVIRGLAARNLEQYVVGDGVSILAPRGMQDY